MKFELLEVVQGKHNGVKDFINVGFRYNEEHYRIDVTLPENASLSGLLKAVLIEVQDCINGKVKP